MEASLLIWFFVIVLALAGLAGLVLPGIPGAPLLFVAALLAAWAENFQYVGVGILSILGVLAVLTYGVDLWATMFGAKRFGASKRAVIGALAGALAGIFLGFPGVLFGPFIGAVIGEMLSRKDLHAATRAGIGATIGLVLGAALKLALSVAMIGIFVVARFIPH
ncbi:MAG TPA: DUF456 domain-containing protein [Candidatus Acidoferrales bacterium]|nr:DUF456 domain-containing protein [Candidatus Acidoferrales bacterium]